MGAVTEISVLTKTCGKDRVSSQSVYWSIRDGAERGVRFGTDKLFVFGIDFFTDQHE